MNHQRYYCTFLDLKGKFVTCLGEGPEMESRKRSFAECGAIVDQLKAVKDELILITPGPGQAETSSIIPQNRAQWSEWIARKSLIVAEPDIIPRMGLELEDLAQLCDEAKTLLCILDRPIYSNFISPAIAEKGPFQIAVSSSGISPSVSVYLRDRIEKELLSDELISLGKFFREHRQIVSERLKDLKLRRAFYFDLIESNFAATLESEDALQAFRSRLDGFCTSDQSKKLDRSARSGHAPQADS